MKAQNNGRHRVFLKDLMSMEFQSKIFHYILASSIFKVSEPKEEIQGAEVQDDKYLLVEMPIAQVKSKQCYCSL